MMTAETWTCPTCAQPCRERFCANCGERALHPHDLTLFGLGWGLESDACRAVIETLVAADVLRWTASGAVTRTGN